MPISYSETPFQACVAKGGKLLSEAAHQPQRQLIAQYLQPFEPTFRQEGVL